MPKLQRGMFTVLLEDWATQCRLRAINRIRKQEKDIFVGSADIMQYYPTCNPDTIIKVLCKYIKDKWVTSLSKEFLSLGYVVLGNISSNILGHINLLDIDYQIVRKFKCDYLRFCDDTIFISDNKQTVRSAITYYITKKLRRVVRLLNLTGVFIKFLIRIWWTSQVSEQVLLIGNFGNGTGKKSKRPALYIKTLFRLL